MLRDLIYRLRSLWLRHRAEAELDEELAFHIERETEKLVRTGLRPEEARRRARLAVGGAAQIKEEVRDEWAWRWTSDLFHDGRYAFRMLWQSPTFTAIAVLSLALGIGANTAIFSILNAVLMKSLPVREPARLGHLYRDRDFTDSFTYALWEQIRERQDVFSNVLAYSQTSFDLAAGGEKKPAQGLYVSGDYFRTLGLAGRIGRLITVDDDQRGGGPAGRVAVLSYGFWQRAYGGDTQVTGRTIRLDGYPFQIIGVTPDGFFGLDVGQTFEVAVPLTSEALFHPGFSDLDHRTNWWLNLMGRLRPGVSFGQASARLKALAPGVYRGAQPANLPRESQSGFLTNTLGVDPAATGNSYLRYQYGNSLTVLMGIVGLVLLIACVNIANLTLARASARQREIAVRLAVGAGRGRLIRQLLTESVILSLFGAGCGVLLAWRGGPAIVSLIDNPRQPLYLDLAPDFRVLAFTVAAAILTGILFGLAPALKAARITTAEALKQGARGLTERQGRWGLGRILVIVQIALSLLLLVGAGLFTGSLRNLLRQDMGFQSESVLVVDPDFRGGKYTAERQTIVREELLARMRAIPGVESAACSDETPMGGGSSQWDVRLDGPGGGRSGHAYFNLVSPGYFKTLHTPLLKGRDIAATDTEASPRVAVINEKAARQFFPDADPIGQIYYDTSVGPVGKEFAVQIVGIVKDAKYDSPRKDAPPTIYLPITQSEISRPIVGAYELRFAGAPAVVIDAVKEAARITDSRIGLQFRLLSAQVAAALLRERLVAMLATFFGVLALILASAGLFGVVAYAAARRRNEIAIRMALGATRRGVLSLMLRDLAGLVLVAMPLGLGAAYAGARLVQSMLYGLAPNDPFTLAGASGLLLLVAGLAGYLPAHRAARLDPLDALREE